MQFRRSARLLALGRSTRFLACTALLALAACGDDDAAGPESSDIEGSWALVSLDGRTVPITESFSDPDFGTCSFTLSSLNMAFAPGGTYSGSITTSSSCENFPGPGPETEAFTGTYRVSGDRVYTIAADDPGSQEVWMQYSVSGNTLTLRANQGGQTQTYVMERQ